VKGLRTPAALFAVLLILLGAAQCLAICVVDDCNAAQPPCHQHHDHSNASRCTQDFQVSEPAHAAAPAVFGMIELPADSISPWTAFEVGDSPSLSPPDSSVSIKTVLRI
jgi:hypothetical protein